MKWIALIGALVMACPAAAQQLPRFQKDTPYSQVRAKLIASGYKVHKIPAAEFDRCAPGRTELCDIYPETRICRGTGRASCEFVLVGPKGAVSITTAGESTDPGFVSIKFMTDREISQMLAE